MNFCFAKVAKYFPLYSLPPIPSPLHPQLPPPLPKKKRYGVNS